MYNRAIYPLLKHHLKPNKVCLLLGARRVGKTIILEKLTDDYPGKVTFLNAEDEDSAKLLEVKSVSNYKRLLNGTDLLIIDEAQTLPDIGLKLKLIIDSIKGIKVIATGSSAFDILNLTGEPLTGRSFEVSLYPMSQLELSKTETLLETRQNLEERLVYGSYPEVLTLENISDKTDYLINLKSSYLLKDILILDGIRNSGKMYDLLRLLAYQVGSEVSYNELGNSLGISKNTVEKYIDLLIKVFVLIKLGGFSNNLRKEITKTHKFYFTDNGIRNALIGDFDFLSLRQDTGQLWENYFITERIKFMSYSKKKCTYYFWRTYDQQEVDLIEVENKTVRAFEIKWKPKKVKAPVFFSKSYPKAKFEVISPDNYLDFIS
ncbi:MAG: ATP-binding protein [Bacteroidetes bacterium]|nr:ATP-binding protein [Bacteroidota bacterium]